MITSLATLQNGEKKEKKYNPALSPSKSKFQVEKMQKFALKKKKRKTLGLESWLNLCCY